MATLEHVEKLRARANVSFEEARDALEACNGDLLDALILLERQGKTASPGDGGYYSSEPAEIVCRDAPNGNGGRHGKRGHYYDPNAEEGWRNFANFWKTLGRGLLKLLEIGSANHFEISRNGKLILAVPVTVFVILLVFFWWLVPVMLLGLFFSFRYTFRGRELGKDYINDAMNGAADAASAASDSFRKSARGNKGNERND
jgi:hypothetical protein